MKIGTILRVVTLGLMPWSWTAHAALINLNPTPGAPDIYVGGFNVSYTANTGVFQASSPAGWASLTYWNHDVNQFDAIGTFNLIANFNPDHSLAGGSLEIRGDIGNGDELLLSGTLRSGAGGAAYGYQDPGPSGAGTHDIFQFTFNVTGGNSAVISDFLALGSVGGINLDANFAYNGTDVPFMGFWNTDFSSSNNNGVGDVFVPEPASYASWMCGAAVVNAVIFRRRNERGKLLSKFLSSSPRKEMPAAG